MDDNPNITPACKEKTIRELSKEEFQQTLNTWLDKKGIIHSIKTYLKYQMVNVLENTVIGRNIKSSNCQSYSLAQQAVHLIVAEYLLYNQCQFTFSLFCSELNLKGALPHHDLFEKCCSKEERSTLFDEENLINLLELLGIFQDNPSFSKIVTEYLDNREKPLLNYLIDQIKRDIKELTGLQENTDKGEIQFMGNISNLLESLKLSRNNYNSLVQNIKQLFDVINQSEETNFSKNKINTLNEKVHNSTKKTHEKQKLDFEVSSLHLPKDDVQCAFVCPLNHCNEECYNMNRLCEGFKNKIKQLQIENDMQKKEIERLSHYSEELIKELNTCQTKVDILNTEFKEDSWHDTDLSSSRIKNDDKKKLNVNSDSAADTVLQRSKVKLKLLEEESKELDVIIDNFIIK